MNIKNRFKIALSMLIILIFLASFLLYKTDILLRFISFNSLGYALPIGVSGPHIVHKGWYTPLGKESELLFIGRLLNITEEKNNIIVIIDLGNSTKIIKKFILNKELFRLRLEQSNNIFPTISDRHITKTLSGTQITSALSVFLNKEAIFDLLLKSPAVITNDTNEEKIVHNVNTYLSCNQLFYQLLLSKNIQNLSCTPYLGLMQVYVPS